MTLKQYLKENRWTITELAQKSGVSRRMITYIIAGKFEMTPDIKKKLCDTLKISQKKMNEIIKNK